MRKISLVVGIVISAVFLFGCKQSEAEKLAKTGPIAIPIVKPIVTMEEWKNSLNSTYKESQKKQIEDGVVEFVAEFNGTSEHKDTIFTFAEHDSFRKLSIFQPTSTKIYVDIGTNVGSYVSILDGAEPMIILPIHFTGKRGWLSMNKLSVLLDDTVIFDRKFEAKKIRHESLVYEFEETSDLVLTAMDIEAFRKIVKTSKIAVRLTGSDGYVNLESGDKRISQIQVFRNSIIESLYIYDSIKNAVATHIPQKN